MPWSSKLMLIFNEGSFPKFDVEDGAFAQRMLVMQHRSAFLKPDAIAATQAPYTYLADEGLKGRLKAAPHKILAWMLQGVELYHDGRLDTIPVTMQQWRSNLAAEQDGALEWIACHVAAKPGSIVELGKLWEAFSQTMSPAQKRKLGAARFKDKAIAHMSDGKHHRGQHTHGDRRIQNCIEGYEQTC